MLLMHPVACSGFLSTGDESAQGNWGLHDIKLCLEWVNRNIAVFGGDPTKVTLFGQGAGAAATMFLALSPMTQGKSQSKQLIFILFGRTKLFF